MIQSRTNPILTALRKVRPTTTPDRLYSAWAHVLHVATQHHPGERRAFTDATDQEVHEAETITHRLARLTHHRTKEGEQMTGNQSGRTTAALAASEPEELLA